MIKDREEAVKFLNSIVDSKAIDSFRYILNFFRVRKDYEGQVMNTQFNSLLLIKKNNILYCSIIYSYVKCLTLILKEVSVKEMETKERIEQFQEQFKPEYKNGEFWVNLKDIALTKRLLQFIYEEPYM